ncbi:MAG: response regulator [Treponema sp.]|jgi:putative two-component system response regulator|nr:response regulator [Treponema sp.]
MENKRDLIILVDDNAANLRTGKNVLADRYNVFTAPSAEKMFGLLERNKPVLILLDVDMPETSGYDAIKILKANPETKDIPVIFLTGKSDSDNELEGLSLGAIDYITKPFLPPLLLKRIEVHLLVEAQKRTLEVQQEKLKNFNDNLQKMVEEKTKTVTELQNAILKTMSDLVEFRDDITGGHIERTQRGVGILLTALQNSGLYQEQTADWDIKLLLQSSQLHDIGKIAISDRILQKPAQLSNEEFEEMKKHTTFGVKVIEKIEASTSASDFLKYAKIFAGTHHEKWNGSGYPFGLAGTDIPLLGRIMAIADVYDALISERSYKKAFTHAEAIKIIGAGSGSHFDPSLSTVFFQMADQFRT